MVRDAERQPASDELVGHGGRRDVAIGSGRPHALRVDGHGVDEAREDAEGGLERGHGAEQRRLVLLEVPLVCEWQPLEHAEDRDERADGAGGSAPDQLGRIRVPLVRHHRAAGRERVGEAHEPEARVRPPRQLLREAAQVDHGQGDRGQRLDHEIPIGHRIHRVRGRPVEAELGRHRRPVDRVAGPGQRARSEGRDVEPATGVGQAAAIPLEHLDVGQHVVGEQHWLGGLDVGQAGQDGLPVALRQRDQRPLEPDEAGVEPVDRPARPQPQVRGDLVVARAARVQPAAGGPDPASQLGLEVEVDVLEARVPLEPPGLDVVTHGPQAGLERRCLVRRKEPGPGEPVDVRDRAVQVVERELTVDLDRPAEVDRPWIALALEPPAPQSHRSSSDRSPRMLAGLDLPDCAR